MHGGEKIILPMHVYACIQVDVREKRESPRESPINVFGVLKFVRKVMELFAICIQAAFPIVCVSSASRAKNSRLRECFQVILRAHEYNITLTGNRPPLRTCIIPEEVGDLSHLARSKTWLSGAFF
jgi:hypothetical protein